jgi:CDP-diacylglycerol--glycerol-3-phosphate 3-phosphatidyltransferase
MAEFVFLSDKNRERYLRIIMPLGNFLARLGVHPNVLSFTGLVLSAVAGLIYSTGSFFWGAWIVVLAGTCDALDGQLARQTEKDSLLGAFFDSTLDRFGEVFILLGLAWHFSGGAVLLEAGGANTDEFQSPLAVVFIILAIAGSFMVSYTRARAEGLGIDCKVGWMQRPERITLLIIGSLLASIPVIGPFVMKLTLLLLAVLSNFTALQRMIYVKNQLLRKTHA